MTVDPCEPPADVPHRLEQPIDRLSQRFCGTFSAETVARVVVDSYEQLAAAAEIETFLPLLAERFAADRLRATSVVEGSTVSEVPEVLFVCVHNAGRSQMAAALLAHHAAGGVAVRSAGSAPAVSINPVAVAAMAELGVDLTGDFPKPLTSEAVQASDVVVTMGCGDACPVFPGKRYLDWDLDDPAGQDLEAVRRIRDDIDRRVRALVAELVPAARRPAGRVTG